VRIPALFFIFGLALTSADRLAAQVPDPGAAQDAEAAREKLLKAADQLDNIQANSEATKLSVDGMKGDLTALQADVQKLQADNADLRQQLNDLKTALATSEAARAKDRQTLIENVAAMLAAGKISDASHPAKKKKVATDSDDTADGTLHLKTADAEGNPTLAPPPDPGTSVSSASIDANQTDTPPPTPKHQKGYYHVVANGETLAVICSAYRDKGVNVTVSAIRKANGLRENSDLKVGQKIFIPKPGT
jgi:LysM repeat protein